MFCSTEGIDSGGTNALETYGMNKMMNVNPLAASGPDATTPMATAIQVSASTNKAIRPSAATQSRAEADGLKPMTNAIAMTRAVDTALRTIDATTCPVSTPVGRIGSERNRSMMPPVMSLATSTAVLADPYPAVSRMIPGTMKST